MKFRLLFTLLLLPVFSCQPLQREDNSSYFYEWKYADLRALDPIDAGDAHDELMALYTKLDNQFFQIRMDFLDLEWDNGIDIYLVIDTYPGGNDLIRYQNNPMVQVDLQWDYLMIIPANGDISVFDSAYNPLFGMGLLMNRDDIENVITLSWKANSIPLLLGITKFQIALTLPNQAIVVEETEPVVIDAPTPPRLKVGFVFWNTFIGRTPAETLRSWAGAHSGPLSSRHGLKYLLAAVNRTGTPVAILDLLNPETIAALDYLDTLQLIRDINDRGLLILFENGKRKYSIDDLYDYESSKKIDYCIYRYNFYEMLGENDYANNRKITHICKDINHSIDYDFSAALKVCQTDLYSATLTSPIDPIIVGGDFNDSLLGDPTISLALFSYIQNHPWMQVLSAEELASYLTDFSKSSVDATQIVATVSTHASIYNQLINSPHNVLTNLAWEVFGMLEQPSSPELERVLENYYGSIGYILAAAKWENRPTVFTSCNEDLDYDNQAECLIATKNLFVTIEPDGGYIPFVFSKDDSGIHQIIGPTWEFLVGLGDQSLWRPELGLLSDPGQILGAMEDNIDGNNYDIVNVKENNIVIEGENMAMRRSIAISGNEISIDIHSQGSPINQYAIPIVLDPWRRFTPAWGDKYFATTTPNGMRWGIQSGPIVEIISSQNIAFYPFNLTHDAMYLPEDPNYDYSLGSYLPYPMALAIIQTAGDYSLNIIINP